ncbi:uncharacterized protein LOC131958034 [Physella acuta]|uniref:uncharacterized protein LOC131958034 n=1 Tax=Physella acuta TaxID=109671 RepID=UPI0027DB6346|nr:uncharacterized protein LOC131958034 [Physella acuta]XP_059178919.1 uncharacterized protein LOC131958034 [Physella acuta]
MEIYVSLTLLFVLLSHSPACGETSTNEESLQRTLVERMDTIKSELSDVIRLMRSLDESLDNALYNCMGIESELCDALLVQVGESPRDLSSLIGRGKRLAVDDHAYHKSLSLLGEIKRKKEMTKRLMRQFNYADSVLTNERKRSCDVNLGFHCQTAEISDFADFYDYLKSPHSPGKKRSVRAVL